VADIDSTTGTVTLAVPTGEISAVTAPGIRIEGTPTSRTLSGDLKLVNRYLATPGRVTYLTAKDATAPVVLTTTVDDGVGVAPPKTSIINVTPVNDPPTITAALQLSAAGAGRPVERTFEDLLRGTAARDVDSPALTLVVQSVTSGTLERRTGTTWSPITTTSSLALRRLGPGQSLRWTPAAGTIGATAAFRLLAADHLLLSDTNASCVVTMQVG